MSKIKTTAEEIAELQAIERVREKKQKALVEIIKAELDDDLKAFDEVDVSLLLQIQMVRNLKWVGHEIAQLDIDRRF